MAYYMTYGEFQSHMKHIIIELEIVYNFQK